MPPRRAATLLWIVSAIFLLLWVCSVWVWRLEGSYYQDFLVIAIGTGLMNLIAHVWTDAEKEKREAEEEAMQKGRQG